MTGDSPVLDRPALRAALSRMQIEEPGTSRRFEEVLAEKQGWTLEFAQRVADEYCGFLYLAAAAGFEVTPSVAVDEAWHLHLEWPHYREVLCGEILGCPLDHRPATGEPEDEARCRRQYEETLDLYERVFGKSPPADIWPRPFAYGEEEVGLKTPLEQFQWLSRRVALGSLVGSVAALAFGAPIAAVFLAGAALIFFLAGRIAVGPARSRGWAHRGAGSCGGGSGAGCGGGGGSSDDCASCGGGGCGGGD